MKCVIAAIIGLGLAGQTQAAVVEFEFSTTERIRDVPSFSIEDTALLQPLAGSRISYSSFGSLQTYSFTQSGSGGVFSDVFNIGTGPLIWFKKSVIEDRVSLSITKAGTIGSYSFRSEDDPCVTTGQGNQALGSGSYESDCLGAFGSIDVDSDTPGTWTVSGEISAVVPLPATLPLLALSVFGLGIARRHRHV